MSNLSLEVPGIRTSAVFCLCCVRFLNAFKPSEPHIVPFLSQIKHFSDEKILHSIFPVVVYANLVAVAFIPTSVQWLGLKGTVCSAAAARILTRILLIWGTSLLAIQISEVCFGVVMAGDIVLDAYVFYLVPQSSFIQAAAITQAASRLGHVAAAEFGELAIAVLHVSLTTLFWVSLAAILGATAFTLALPGQPQAPQQLEAEDEACMLAAAQPRSDSWTPSVGYPPLPPLPPPPTELASRFASLADSTPRLACDASARRLLPPLPCSSPRNLSAPDEPTPADLCDAAKPHSCTTPRPFTSPRQPQHPSPCASEVVGSCGDASTLPVQQLAPPPAPPVQVTGMGLRNGATLGKLRRVAADPRLLLLSVWWAAVYGPVLIFVESYITNVYEEVDATRDYNGHVDAAAALARIGGALCAPLLRPAAVRRPGAAHGVWLAVVAACIAALSRSGGLLAAYAWYVVVVTLLQAQVCVVQAESAAAVAGDDYSALFGLNQLATLLLQCVLQAGLQVSGWGARPQFGFVALWAAAVAAGMMLWQCCPAWRPARAVQPVGHCSSP
eukprot:jgi/Ulvmu1/3055/UM015_0095.1